MTGASYPCHRVCCISDHTHKWSQQAEVSYKSCDPQTMLLLLTILRPHYQNKKTEIPTTNIIVGSKPHIDRTYFTVYLLDFMLLALQVGITTFDFKRSNLMTMLEWLFHRTGVSVFIASCLNEISL